MAISSPHYQCLKELHRRGELPQGGALLEIGEANWYGDIAPLVKKPQPSMATVPASMAVEYLPPNAFEIVKGLYAELFGNPRIESIDMHGTEAAHKMDLNGPVMIAGDTHWCPVQFNTVYNHGTAEHIFNISNVYATMHAHCAVGGLLIHESPFTGWIDHGFYTIQPTLYFDLAAANGYQMVFMAVEHIEHQSVVEIHSREQLLAMAKAGGVPNNAMLYVAMRKTKDEPFKIPMQGFYNQSLSAEAHEAWRELR